MNCAKHPDTVAVATCRNCEVGLCPDCIEKSELIIENRSLCRTCNYSTISNMLEKDKSAKKWLIVRLIFNGFFLLVGTSIFILEGVDGLPVIIFIMAISGIPTAWRAMSSDSPEDKLKTTIQDATAVDGGFTNSIFRFIFKVIFVLVIGAIIAPFLLIVNIVKLAKCRKRIEENSLLLKGFA